MNKVVVFISVLSFSLHFGQLSKIREVDKKYQSINKEIIVKYRNVNSLERIREEDENNSQRLDGYELAIKNIQKDEHPVEESSLLHEVTKLPEYESGIEGFRSLIANNFDSSMITITNAPLKTNAQFIIDEQGKISHVKANGESREFNLLTILTLYELANKGKWTPAEKDGVPLKYLFTLPLTMQFQ